jgi:hypothetical protein
MVTPDCNSYHAVSEGQVHSPITANNVKSSSSVVAVLNFSAESRYAILRAWRRRRTADETGHGRWRYRSAVERRRFACPLGSLRATASRKSGMIYVKSILAGIACVCVASFLMLEAMGAYLSVVYRVEAGPRGWNSSFLTSPLNWFLTAAMFFGGFFWEFRRARSK